MANITSLTEKKVGIPDFGSMRPRKDTADDIKRLQQKDSSDDTNKTKKPSKIPKSSKTYDSSETYDPVEWNYLTLPPGVKTSIISKEYEIENTNDAIKFYENKLENNNLALAEYRTISNDIDEMKQNLPKKEKELRKAKIELIKRYRRL